MLQTNSFTTYSSKVPAVFFSKTDSQHGIYVHRKHTNMSRKELPITGVQTISKVHIITSTISTVHMVTSTNNLNSSHDNINEQSQQFT